MVLNGGELDGRRVIGTETVDLMAQNHIGELRVQPLPTVNPVVSNDAEFFPGLSKSWSFSFMVNDEEAPTGRPAGALGWAGLANLFYWIDRQNGYGGFWATQILPFGDAASFTGYVDFESQFYASLAAANAA